MSVGPNETKVAVSYALSASFLIVALIVVTCHKPAAVNYKKEELKVCMWSLEIKSRRGERRRSDIYF